MGNKSKLKRLKKYVKMLKRMHATIVDDRTNMVADMDANVAELIRIGEFKHLILVAINKEDKLLLYNGPGKESRQSINQAIDLLKRAADAMTTYYQEHYGLNGEEHPEVTLD